MISNTPSFPASWNIEAAKRIADTPAGIVYELTRKDGSLAIAKVLKKKVLKDSLRGADFIAWRAGIGCVELLDQSDNILLMEHAGTETLRDVLFRDGNDDATTEIAAEVLLRYHQPSEQSPPSSLLTLPLYFESLFRKAEQDRSDGVDSPFVEAARLAQTLIDQQRDIKPLHGDLHHENIMHSDRGWIIIDPAGLIGDAALDVANMHVAMGITAGIMISIRFARRLAETGSAADQRFVNLVPGGLRPHEGLIIKTGREHRRQEVVDGAQIKGQRRETVLRGNDGAVEHLLHRGAHIGLLA